MPMEITTRKASIIDLDSIIELNKELFDFEDQFGHEYNTNWPFEDGKTYFKKRLENKNSMNFVAIYKNKIIGYIVSFIDTYKYRDGKINPICEVENMFVKQEYRKKGIGKLLINAVKNAARKKKVKLLRVGAIAQNINAINFYRSQGFHDSNLFLEQKI